MTAMAAAQTGLVGGRAQVLSTTSDFEREFVRCCREYSSLHMAVAWCGHPQQTLPYDHLRHLSGSIVATVGFEFNQTHPEAVSWLTGIGANVRMFRREKGLFHPKVYLFTNRDKYALFAGSSNLTFHGFYKNLEVNSLVEGSLSADSTDIRTLLRLLDDWHSEQFSFEPSADWLKTYRKQYNRDRTKQRKSGISSPVIEEERAGYAGWLEDADWRTYYDKVMEGLKRQGRDVQRLQDVLDAAAKQLPFPWRKSYFRDPERRGLIGGAGKHGPFGNVLAAGSFGHLLKGGQAKWATIIHAVNHIATLNHPVDWKPLEADLSKLVTLGNSMKVWGRILCLIRPDLYCSVSSKPVRKELGKTLGVPANSFETASGYIRLLKLVHGSKWFNSPSPANKLEAAVWRRRTAFLDGIVWARD